MENALPKRMPAHGVIFIAIGVRKIIGKKRVQTMSRQIANHSINIGVGIFYREGG